MKSVCHCHRRRFASFLCWLVPGTLLALMPKCPMCFAAYIALGTGIGLSLPAASFLRGSLIAISAGSLTFLVIRTIRKRSGALPPQ